MEKPQIWLYKFNDGLTLRHRKAYEKSLTSSHAVKVHRGMYYYKGFCVDYEEEREKNYQWSFEFVSPYPEERTSCATKAECIQNIDALIEFYGRENFS